MKNMIAFSLVYNWVGKKRKRKLFYKETYIKCRSNRGGEFLGNVLMETSSGQHKFYRIFSTNFKCWPVQPHEMIREREQIYKYFIDAEIEDVKWFISELLNGLKIDS